MRVSDTSPYRSGAAAITCFSVQFLTLSPQRRKPCPVLTSDHEIGTCPGSQHVTAQLPNASVLTAFRAHSAIGECRVEAKLLNGKCLMSSQIQFIGASGATRVIREEIAYASGSDAKVLITGESGVGKEVVAQLVHQQSRRRNAPLITLNCAGVPDTLLASELFGHMRGSFTDAHRDKPGYLEQANRGTIFLDEVGEMSLQMQSLLLRFLENGEIQRVGSEKLAAKVDVRVIAATNRKLVERIAANEFREDLFYRLNVIHIPIPPLRERREDIPLLLDHFLRQFSKNHGVENPRLSAEAAAQLAATDWPGNVRQIRNVAERLVLRAKEGLITIADLPREVLSPYPPDAEHPEDPRATPIYEELFDRMVRRGETFWAIVY